MGSSSTTSRVSRCLEYIQHPREQTVDISQHVLFGVMLAVHLLDLSRDL